MAFTPLLKKLNESGTTFYTFSSAARDLSKCIANTQKEFVFSHFVCINIPDFINNNNYNHSDASTMNNSSACPGSGGTITISEHKNYTQIGAIEGLLNRDSGSNPQKVKTTSLEFAELLQDYLFNFEELLLDRSDDNNTDRSVAERAFWHWMKEMGAINWKYDASKVAEDLTIRQEARFVEGNDSLLEYENVVKYIGSIDITNNVDIANEAYTEIYVHIPSEVGNTPTVLFKQEFDGNFSANDPMQVTNNQNYILGQSAENSDPNGLTYSALYDSNYTYRTAAEVDFGSSPSTTQYTAGSTNWGVNAYKTSLDGVCIDFNTNSYAEIVNSNIPNIDEFNKLGDSFEFNAVLVYYDIVDVSSQEKTSNLYGILFLDDVKSDHPGWDYFQRYPKFKPLAGVQNGNSYGFKLNLRIDIEPEKNGITTFVNDYNTFSMSLFADAIARMQQCTEMFTRARGSISNIESRLSDLESVMTMISNYEVVAQKVEELSQALENANLAFADRNSLLDLIAHVSDNVDSIINGRASVELQYNTDVIRGGYNTAIDTSAPNQVVVNTVSSGYNLCDAILKYDNSKIDEESPIVLNDQDHENDILTSLKPVSNMLRIYVNDEIPSIYDINVYIDSSLVNWRTGQNFKIVFPNLSLQTLNGFNINIFTGDNYSIVHRINSTDLENNKPIIELTCIDGTLSTDHPFVHDILR